MKNMVQDLVGAKTKTEIQEAQEELRVALSVEVEECDKNGVQEFNLPDGYRVSRGTSTEIDNLKYFFIWMVAACNLSKNNFCDEKGKKLISNIFSISDEAFALLALYNKSHQWKADAKKIRKRDFLVKLKTQQLHWS